MLCLPVAAKNKEWVGSRSSKESKWEIGANIGLAYFTGSMNMYKGARFQVYNVTDSKPGVNFNFRYRYNFGATVFADFDFNLSTLSGDVTYYGIPSEGMTIELGDQAPYKTTVYRFVPMIGFDLIRLFNLDSWESPYSAKFRGGFGFTYTNVVTLPFEGESTHYDFAEVLPTDFCGVLSVEVKRELNEKVSLSALFDYSLVAGSRIDAYWIGQDDDEGGIPGPEEGDPVLLDTYISFSLGMTYRIGTVNSVHNRSYLRKYKGGRRHRRQWYQ